MEILGRIYIPGGGNQQEQKLSESILNSFQSVNGQ